MAAPATGPAGSDTKQYDGPGERSRLEQQGIKTVRWALGEPDVSALPSDFTHVLNAAVHFDDRHDIALHSNAVGAAMLMAHLGVDTMIPPAGMTSRPSVSQAVREIRSEM